jgi:DNA-nicking Smr family endonuclease
MTRVGIAQWIPVRRAITLRPVDEPIEMPIDGVLDLHTFRPRDVKDLVPDYLAACREKGIFLVRIIHGKGIGNLRRTVHALLSRDATVDSFALDHPEYGGWGATLVRLKPIESTAGPDASKPVT